MQPQPDAGTRPAPQELQDRFTAVRLIDVETGEMIPQDATLTPRTQRGPGSPVTYLGPSGERSRPMVRVMGARRQRSYRPETVGARYVRLYRPGTVAEVLERTATQLETFGWFRGDFYDAEQEVAGTPESECRSCLYGALSLVATGQAFFYGLVPGSDLLWTAQATMEDYLGEPVATFNDADERTLSEVTAALRTVAARLRDGDVLPVQQGDPWPPQPPKGELSVPPVVRDQLHRAARFYRAAPEEEPTDLPAMEVFGVMVFCYLDGPHVRVSIDLDEAIPALTGHGEERRVPLHVTIQDRTVFADPLPVRPGPHPARPGTAEGEAIASMLFEALLKEASEWADDGEESALVERLDEMPRSSALDALASAHLVPGQLLGPVAEAINRLAPNHDTSTARQPDSALPDTAMYRAGDDAGNASTA